MSVENSTCMGEFSSAKRGGKVCLLSDCIYGISIPYNIKYGRFFELNFTLNGFSDRSYKSMCEDYTTFPTCLRSKRPPITFPPLYCPFTQFLGDVKPIYSYDAYIHILNTHFFTLGKYKVDDVKQEQSEDCYLATLHIKDTSATDSRAYYLAVENDRGTDRHAVQLYVNGKHFLIVFPLN